MKISLDKYCHSINSACPIRVEGQVTKVVGTIIEGSGPAMPVGGISISYLPVFPNPLQLKR